MARGLRLRLGAGRGRARSLGRRSSGPRGALWRRSRCAPEVVAARRRGLRRGTCAVSAMKFAYRVSGLSDGESGWGTGVEAGALPLARRPADGAWVGSASAALSSPCSPRQALSPPEWGGSGGPGSGPRFPEAAQTREGCGRRRAGRREQAHRRHSALASSAAPDPGPPARLGRRGLAWP